MIEDSIRECLERIDRLEKTVTALAQGAQIPASALLPNMYGKTQGGLPVMGGRWGSATHLGEDWRYVDDDVMVTCSSREEALK